MAKERKNYPLSCTSKHTHTLGYVGCNRSASQSPRRWLRSTPELAKMQTTWLDNQGENGRGVQDGFFDIFCFKKNSFAILNPSQAVKSELQENCSLQFVWASVIGAIFQEIFAVRILVALTPPPSPFSCWRRGWSLRRARGL